MKARKRPKPWWVGLRCLWCGRPVTQTAADGIWHQPANAEPWCEHFACREGQRT